MIMTNRYPGRCYKCNGQIPVSKGIIENETGKWRLSHPDGQCVNTLSTHASGDFALAKNIAGHEFKPDASVPKKPDARCSNCGTAKGVAWIAGAGSYLCYRHQDDY